MSAVDLARPELLALQPYASARLQAGQAAVMLNANESPWPPLAEASRGLNRYPDPQPALLRTRLAALYGVNEEQLLIGRGSDEAIDLLVRAFCRAGVDAVAVSPPTFGMYAVCAGVQGAAVISVPLQEDFTLSVDGLLERLPDNVKLLFVCSPNNPTGGLVPLGDIGRLVSALSGRAMVIVDEAYIEFADTPSATTLLGQFDNLGVLRTLSKCWALAGARIGTLIAHPDVIALLRRIMSPYPLPTPCVKAALAALDERGTIVMRSRVKQIVTERERLARWLGQWPQTRQVYPSCANFLTVRFADAARVYGHLLASGIVVRDINRQGALANCLRFSVGSEVENSRLLEALAEVGVPA